jgi:MFS family permease
VEKAPVTKRTFRLEVTRALLAGGIVEAFSATFILYFLITVYHGNDTMKSAVMSSQRAGLLLGFLAVTFAHRSHRAPSRLAASVFFLASIGLIVGAAAETAMVFAVSVAVASCLWSCTPPLVTQFLRANYPSETRGRLFSMVSVVRGLAAVMVGLVVGHWLEGEGNDARAVLWLLPFAFLIASVLLWQVPVERQLQSLGRLPQRSFWAAFGWLVKDKRFALAIVAWMFVGMGMLMCGGLLVEYVANPDYARGYSPLQVALVTVVIPTSVQLLTTITWGGLFDRVRFFRLRLVLNTLGSMAVLVLFLSPAFWGVCVGAALLGLFRGGGNVAWNLWVTKLAPEDHVGEYMSVHTFFTGIRGIATPWLGFYLLREHGVVVFAWTCFILVTLSSLAVLPLLKGERNVT